MLRYPTSLSDVETMLSVGHHSQSGPNYELCRLVLKRIVVPAAFLLHVATMLRVCFGTSNQRKLTASLYMPDAQSLVFHFHLLATHHIRRIRSVSWQSEYSRGILEIVGFS